MFKVSAITWPVHGTIEIHDNAQGCNSPEEVEEGCIVGIGESSHPASLIIHPNPSNNGIISINLANNQGKLVLTCFNTFGQEVHQQEIISTKIFINVSSWQPGIYLAVLYSDGKPVGRAKFVIQ